MPFYGAARYKSSYAQVGSGMSVLSSKATLIYNPHAGYGNSDSSIRRASQFWQERGWHVYITPTIRAGHASDLARHAAAEGHGLVIAAGGDGTLNEVANGLANTETIMAPLPVGTSNSFAKELRMPRPNLLEPYKLVDSSRALLNGCVQQMDLGFCKVGPQDPGRYWMLWVGTGADSFVVDQIEPRTKLFKQLGPAGYAAKALFFLPDIPSTRAKVTVDGQQFDDDFIMITVTNCRLYAGGEIRLSANAVLDDGLFEVWLFRGQAWSSMMRYILEMGLENHANDPNVDMLYAKSVSIETDPPFPFHIDGEPVGQTPFCCEIHPQVLRLLVPQTAPPGLFSQAGVPLEL